MSVDLRWTDPAECNRRAAEVALLPPEVRHTLVFFGGYVGRDPGGDGDLGVTRTEEDGRVRGSWQALQEIRNLGRFEIFDSNPRMRRADRGPGRHLTERWAGFLDGMLDRVFGRLDGAGRRSGGSFDPRGALVVYGYSAGGFNALKLCERIAAFCNWYNFRRRTVGNLTTVTPEDSREGARVQVDLLLTVDPCIQDIDPEEQEPAAAARLVRRHVNYYQDVDRYRGRQIPTANIERRMVWAHPAASHEMMPVTTLPDVLDKIHDTMRVF